MKNIGCFAFLSGIMLVFLTLAVRAIVEDFPLLICIDSIGLMATYLVFRQLWDKTYHE
jgi:hypothetical protein